ncbi:MAG: hypothetical protein R3C01_06840 [Planctomycetaceae bacterium]
MSATTVEINGDCCPHSRQQELVAIVKASTDVARKADELAAESVHQSCYAAEGSDAEALVVALWVSVAAKLSVEVVEIDQQ